MCSTIFLRRPNHLWPLLFAGNRDEMNDRPWDPPGYHWGDRPETFAGRDRLSGGSWLGLNKAGLLTVVLNRYGTLGPAKDKRSRGELVLEALDHSDANQAAAALADLNPQAYRGFNLVIADSQDAYWLRHKGDAAEEIEVFPLPSGLSMLTAFDLNDESPRIALHKPKFAEASPPDVDEGDWESWEGLMASRETAKADPGSAMSVDYASGFQTVSSSLIALPSPELVHQGVKPVWRFASGRPDQNRYEALEL